jgi:hypothetical protein
MVDTERLLGNTKLDLAGSDSSLDFEGKSSPKGPRNFSLNPGAVGAGMAPKSANQLLMNDDKIKVT